LFLEVRYFSRPQLPGPVTGFADPKLFTLSVFCIPNMVSDICYRLWRINRHQIAPLPSPTQFQRLFPSHPIIEHLILDIMGDVLGGGVGRSSY